MVSKVLVFTLLVFATGCGLGGGGGSNSGSSKSLAVSLDAAVENPELLEQYPCTEDDGSTGVLICHIPPGKFNSLHDICVSPHAIKAHITEHHGGDKGYPDVLGSCRDAF